LAGFVLIERKGSEIEGMLLKAFADVESLEHFYTTYKYKVPRSMKLSDIFKLIYEMVMW